MVPVNANTPIPVSFRFKFKLPAGQTTHANHLMAFLGRYPPPHPLKIKFQLYDLDLHKVPLYEATLVTVYFLGGQFVQSHRSHKWGEKNRRNRPGCGSKSA